MKLTATMIAAFATLLYLLIKSIRPDFPLEENTVFQIIFWLISALLGIAVEPTIRAALVNSGFTGFRYTGSPYPYMSRYSPTEEEKSKKS
jgi:hypothetical protein